MASTAPFRALPSEFRNALHAFAQSSSTFGILRTVRSRPNSSSPQSHSSPSSPGPPPEKLHVLDSSFNPPTLGHLSIVLSALRDTPLQQPKHVLLLLATQNADKAAKPAAFEMRLTMMAIMAESILESFQQQPEAAAIVSSPGEDASRSVSTSNGGPVNCERAEGLEVTVSIGVTKHPYFIDKSHDIAGTGEHKDGSVTSFPFPPTHQIHLIGFDTFIRLMDPQYYPPSHTLAPLDPLFANHSVRVTYRTGGKYGDKQAQDRYVAKIADGGRDAEGARREWAAKVRLVEGRDEEVKTSSTEAREEAKKGDWEAVRGMCGGRVADWVREEGLYREAGDGK